MKPSVNAPNELNLVSSSRLKALRDKQLQEQAGKAHSSPAKTSKAETSDLAVAQQLIDSALQQIISQLPVGKQRSMFKIRYGVDPADVKQLPILDVFKLLNISQQALTNLQAIAQLNYNGDRI